MSFARMQDARRFRSSRARLPFRPGRGDRRARRRTNMRQNGIHHVTAIAGPARRNLDFYTRTLGLRLVKKTVNFDDPGTYHFYYGDETGRPGTILTFFPWRACRARPARGRRDRRRPRSACPKARSATGPIASSSTACAMRRRRSASARRCWRSAIRTACAWRWSACPASRTSPPGAAATSRLEHAIRGFHGVSLLLAEAAPTGAILTDVLGFERGRAREARWCASSPATRPSAASSICTRPAAFLPAGMGGGSVHHIAFRAAG